MVFYKRGIKYADRRVGAGVGGGLGGDNFDSRPSYILSIYFYKKGKSFSK